MANEMPELMALLGSTLKAAIPAALFLLGGGSLYKLIEKLLDNRDKHEARELASDDAGAVRDRDRIRELEERLDKALARLGPLMAENAALRTAAETRDRHNRYLKGEIEELKRQLSVSRETPKDHPGHGQS